ncbi:MAG: hypothetical protein LAT64_05565 [Phycisphaerales bacterium]|nr:hypothetical protein [Planctomycetota bacterium]MCH8508224.1 hypothetical protein [Phycisphaerales bacterium]
MIKPINDQKRLPPVGAAVFLVLRRFLLVAFGVVAASLAYSSLNAHLWGQYRAMVEVGWDGTRGLSDMDRTVLDRAAAWDSDPWWDSHTYVDASLIHYPLGITGSVEMVERWPVLVAAAVLLCLLCHAAVSLILWRSVRRRLAGLDGAFFRLPEVRHAQRRIMESAVLVAVITLPVAGGLSWYVFYDRLQTSYSYATSSQRLARYLYESFSPLPVEWALIVACAAVSAAAYAWVASRRLVLGLRPDWIVPYHKLCSGCGYPLAGLPGPCSECGLPTDSPSRPDGWFTPPRAALGAAVLLLAIAAAGFFAIRMNNEGYVYWPVRQWVTMRGDSMTVHSEVYLIPHRPIMLRWGGVDVWIVIWYREPFVEWTAKPGYFQSTEVPVVVCKIGEDPAVVINPIDFQPERPDRLLVGEEEVLVWAWGGGLTPIRGRGQNWTVRIRVLSMPEKVQGFGLSGTLTPEAAAFLEEVRMTVGGPVGQDTD